MTVSAQTPGLLAGQSNAHSNDALAQKLTEFIQQKCTAGQTTNTATSEIIGYLLKSLSELIAQKTFVPGDPAAMIGLYEQAFSAGVSPCGSSSSALACLAAQLRQQQLVAAPQPPPLPPPAVIHSTETFELDAGVEHAINVSLQAPGPISSWWEQLKAEGWSAIGRVETNAATSTVTLPKTLLPGRYDLRLVAMHANGQVTMTYGITLRAPVTQTQYLYPPRIRAYR